jgi:superfamily II DNA or RNA helicase
LAGEGFQEVVKGKKTQLIINSTLKSLTDHGWLAPIKYFVASIPDLSNVSLNKGDYSEDEAKKVMELAPIVDSYLQHANGKRGVCFCINVEHSKSITHQYNLAGITAAHLDANCSKEYRAQILNDFRTGKLKIIANVGIITEGFDFPDLEMVQLARPTKSLSMYLQMVGRVTRAEGGLVDRFELPEIRKKAIEASSKPFGLVLDNAGCWQDHNLPDWDHNWEKYFKGQVKQKKVESSDDMFEMLVYVVEDEKGNKMTKFNAKEIEGLKLVEVTRTVREKIINLKSIKEFDKQYILAQRITQIKKPGYVAFLKYIDYCKSNNYLIVPEVWDYIEKKLITEIHDRMTTLEHNRTRYPDSYPKQIYDKQMERIQALGVSRHFLKKHRIEYETQNENEIKKYLGRKVLAL